MNIKLALKLCLSNTGWLQQLNWRHGPAIRFTHEGPQEFVLKGSTVHFKILVVYFTPTQAPFPPSQWLYLESMYTI